MPKGNVTRFNALRTLRRCFKHLEWVFEYNQRLRRLAKEKGNKDLQQLAERNIDLCIEIGINMEKMKNIIGEYIKSKWPSLGSKVLQE